MRIEKSADVEPSAFIGHGTQVWHLVQIREKAQLGLECVVGRGAYIGPGVICGDRCKIQNYALLYEPAVLDDGVFIGPGVIFTNDLRPRAVNTDGTAKAASDWQLVGVRALTGASVGARSVCVAPITLGAWSMVGSGSTVLHDVLDHALVVGSPARQIGWVCKCGERLNQIEDDDEVWRCVQCSVSYIPVEQGLVAI